MMLESMELVKYFTKNAPAATSVEQIMQYNESEISAKVRQLLLQNKDQFQITLYNLSGFFHKDLLYFFTSLVQSNFDMAQFPPLFEQLWKNLMQIKEAASPSPRFQIEAAEIVERQFLESVDCIAELKSVYLLIEHIKQQGMKIGVRNCQKIIARARKIIEKSSQTFPVGDLNQFIYLCHLENDWENELFFTEQIKQSMLAELKSSIPEKQRS